MGLYLATKRSYRKLVPARLRHWLLDPKSPAAPLMYTLKRVLERGAPHNQIYDANYYEHIDTVMHCSSEAIAESIVTTLKPQAILDVGCGTGALIQSLARRGVQARGLEYSEAALAICRSRGLDVRKFDLEHDALDREQYDVVVSTEVAEHLPASVADRYVDTLCSSAPVIAMTAATPGQGGTDHVNEQPHEYWMEKFQQRGFDFQKQMSTDWRAQWTAAGAAPCYCKNVMVFRTTRAA